MKKHKKSVVVQELDNDDEDLDDEEDTDADGGRATSISRSISSRKIVNLHIMNICCPQKWGGQNTLRPPHFKKWGDLSPCPPYDRRPWLSATEPLGLSHPFPQARHGTVQCSTAAMLLVESDTQTGYSSLILIRTESSCFPAANL